MIKQQFEEAQRILAEFISNPENLHKIQTAGSLMVDAVREGNKIISCGNGGSMCDAMHFAEELSGRYRNDRPAIAAVSISDPSHITCVGNDYGFEFIFSRYLESVGKPGDVLLAISTSGNSSNVLRAVETARRRNIHVVALTGKSGGKLAELADVEIRAPYSEYADRAQEIHIKVIHSLIGYIEAEMFQQ
jgi:D-sedoheptulose 7-phosphate isomerase